MNSERPDRVSVIDPISPAIERVKLMLFSPFDLRKWLVIGFCAWLAYLGSGGGGGGGSGGGGGGPRYTGPPGHHEKQDEIRRGIESARDYFSQNSYWIIPVVVAGVVLVIAIGLLIAWLNSRGRFMFLHCVATDRAQVKVPWHKFRKHGNSLFLFRIVLGLIGLLVVGLPIIGIVVCIIMLATGTVAGVASVPGIIIFAVITFVFAIALLLVKKFTLDFVVPTMFLQTASCLAGWRGFMAILSANKARFALYLLFQIVIKIVIGAIVGIACCIGVCLCCASCLLLIPYIGTVILLPLLVFERAYSLYYLQQFGPRFDVFRVETETVAPA
ncbi:MAG: hypothetical protein JSW66_09085 [Phycisphaerales bacterium]|nr:MAG: hypothetical protein JSW66_09085 [Phycisphaerales bacterium]